MNYQYRKHRKRLFVAVKVERGYVCEAKIFESLKAAERVEKKWRDRLNPDYDEAAVIESHIVARRKRKRVHSS